MVANPGKRRFILRLVLGLVVLLVAAAVLVPVLVPADRWKELALDRLHEETGLVATAGSAQVGLFPPGLRLKDLSVADPLGRPEYAGLELELQEARVQAQWGPLLSGRVEVDRVLLRKPVVRLREIDAPMASGGSGNANSVASVSIALAAVQVEDGMLEWSQKDGTQIRVQGLNNTASVHLAGEDGTAAATGGLDSLTVRAPGAPDQVFRDLRWKLDADFQVDNSAGKVVFRELFYRGAELAGELSWEAADGVPPVVDAEFTGQAELTQLARDWFDDARGNMQWPEGVDPAGFGGFSGDFKGSLGFHGAIEPGATPRQQFAQVDVDGQLRNFTGTILGVDGLIDMDSRLKVDNGVLVLGDVVLRHEAARLEGQLSMEPVGGQSARLELHGPVRSAAAYRSVSALWPQLTPFFGPDLTPPAEWPVPEGEVDLQLEMTVPLVERPTDAGPPPMSWTAGAGRLELVPPGVDLTLVLEDVQLTGDATTVRWNSGTVKAPGMDLTPDLLIRTGDRTSIRGSVAARSLDLDLLSERMAPPVETARGNWFVGAARAAAAGETWVPPADLNADVQLRASEVLTRGYQITNVVASARLVDQQLQLSDVNAALGEGNVTGVAGVDFTADPPTWSTKLHARDVPAGTLLEPRAPLLASALQTLISGDVEFTGGLNLPPEAAIAGLVGDVVLRSGVGSLETTPIFGDRIGKFLADRAPKWQHLVFNALDANLRVEQGAVLFDRVFLSGETELSVGGKVGLDGSCDYRMDILLPPGATPDVGDLQPVVDLLRDENGRFPFAVAVTGPARKPRVQIDFEALGNRADERARDELGDSVRDAVGGLLDRVKGGGGAP